MFKRLQAIITLIGFVSSLSWGCACSSGSNHHSNPGELEQTSADKDEEARSYKLSADEAEMSKQAGCQISIDCLESADPPLMPSSYQPALEAEVAYLASGLFSLVVLNSLEPQSHISQSIPKDRLPYWFSTPVYLGIKRIIV